ncbi:class I SAM-dependent methyltransferase [Nocardioides sp.]|uniref:class I SAM-dependent methyltransferase n=1 Tax=Nocardioides sp. TaxID=35761 RepID=UPI002BD6EF7C|nr:class I SAM-dependent methyltransferase [Nocardioides sp.]HXH78440.1 class I SAM-dependent methyltransferase [Nocardioides sp.]
MAIDTGSDPMTAESSFSDVFARALLGEPTSVVGLDGTPSPLPMASWLRPADSADHRMLALCEGPTIDIGCGPGRMTVALSELGHLSLGIDVVPEAVELTRRRGASALRRDVFDRLPSEGRWQSALLADGNVGIGGDPVALLARVRELLDPRGRMVVELMGPGVRSSSGWGTLEGAAHRSRPFRWAVVGVDDVHTLASSAGLVVDAVHDVGGRWVAVLREDPT